MKPVMIVPTSTRLAWRVLYVMFYSVTGDECRASRKRSNARRSGAGWGSDGIMVGGEAKGRYSRGTGRKWNVDVRSTLQ